MPTDIKKKNTDQGHKSNHLAPMKECDQINNRKKTFLTEVKDGEEDMNINCHNTITGIQKELLVKIPIHKNDKYLLHLSYM